MKTTLQFSPVTHTQTKTAEKNKKPITAVALDSLSPQASKVLKTHLIPVGLLWWTAG